MPGPDPTTPAATGIAGSVLPGPFPVGTYAVRLQRRLREFARVQLTGELSGLRVRPTTVYFELRAGGQSVAYGRIRVNGTAVGTLRTTPTGPSGQLGPVQAYTENITVAAGDLVQLYCSYSGINFGVCKNFKLKTNLTLSTDGVEQDDGGFNYAWGA